MTIRNVTYEQIPYDNAYLHADSPRTYPRATGEIVGQPPRLSLEELMRMGEFQGWQAPSGGWMQESSTPVPMGLQGTPPPPPSAMPEQFYRGVGPQGEMSYTNIPEIAAQKGLQAYNLPPPIAQIGGVEMYGTSTEDRPGPEFGGLEAARRTGAFTPAAATPTTSAPNMFPRSADEAQAEINRMFEVGPKHGFSPEEIMAHVKERGLDKMLTAKATMIPIDIEGTKYQVSPEQYAAIMKTRGTGKAGATKGATESTEEIAGSMFNKPYYELTQDEKKQVLDAKRERRVEGREATPLSATDLQKYINPETLSKYPAGSTLADVAKDKAVSVSPKQLENIETLDNAEMIVESIDSMTKNLITAKDPSEAAIQAAKLHTGALTRQNPLAKTYRDTRQTFLSVLSRTVGGEKGVLTDTDIKRINNAMPEFSDTAEVRDLKVNLMKLALETQKESFKNILRGKGPDPEKNLRAKVDTALRQIETGKIEQPPAAPTGGIAAKGGGTGEWSIKRIP